MVLFMLMSWKFNVLLSGEGTAKTMGINVEGLRFVSMLVASVITAACVLFGRHWICGHYLSLM